jgi:hypothetical protein
VRAPRPQPASRTVTRRGITGRVRLLAGMLLLLPALLAAAPRIGLLTMAPGEEYWARFGHNALLVVEPDGGATSYNFGYFDFEQQDFMLRFLRGRMLYRLVALPAERDIAQYASEGRGVALQWLALDAAQSRELADFLRWHALPENADYRYDYFFDNCSTRVRDAIDRALGGELLRQTRSRSRGITARDESLRLAQTLPWLMLGIHFGLGPATDQPLSRWGESFIPERLAEAVREVRLDDGRALVESEQQLAPHRLRATPPDPPRTLLPFLIAGVLLALALAHALRKPPGAWRSTATVAIAGFWLTGGLLGTGLLGLWLLTDHSAAWANSNLLLLPPLMLGLLPATGALRWQRRQPRWIALLALAVLAAAVVGLVHTTLARQAQANADWIALLLPLHAVLAAHLWRANRAGPDVAPAG